MRLKDQVAVITGAAQGIGREYALRFAAEGAAVALLDKRVEQAQDGRKGNHRQGCEGDRTRLRRDRRKADGGNCQARQ